MDSCSECDSKNNIVIKKARKVYCRECWKYHCEFRFRKRLFEFGRPAKGTVGEVFKPTQPAGICYDGSPTSVALINLALSAIIKGGNQSKNEGSAAANLPFPFRFAIVVILESELNGSPGVEGRQKKHLSYLQKWVNSANAKLGSTFQFSLILSSLECSLKEYHTAESVTMFDETPLAMAVKQECHTNDDASGLNSTSVDDLPLPFNESLDCHLMELRKSLRSKTDDKDFVRILKRKLQLAISNQLLISKVLLPEDQTSLAVKMFTMMSLGRGSQIADEMAFTSSVPDGVTLARPLIDFSDDDLRSYLDCLDEELTDGLVAKGTKRKMKIDSVDRQCDDFIVNLQKGYPATVSTLTRIGAKLQSGVDALSNTNQIETYSSLCRFCAKQLELGSDLDGFCYGCQHFLHDAHPEKKDFFKNLFRIKDGESDSV